MQLKTLLAGAMISAVFVQAAVAGTVSGLVTDESGAPFAGVNV